MSKKWLNACAVIAMFAGVSFPFALTYNLDSGGTPGHKLITTDSTVMQLQIKDYDDTNWEVWRGDRNEIHRINSIVNNTVLTNQYGSERVPQSVIDRANAVGWDKIRVKFRERIPGGISSSNRNITYSFRGNELVYNADIVAKIEMQDVWTGKSFKSWRPAPPSEWGGVLLYSYPNNRNDNTPYGPVRTNAGRNIANQFHIASDGYCDATNPNELFSTDKGKKYGRDLRFGYGPLKTNFGENFTYINYYLDVEYYEIDTTAPKVNFTPKNSANEHSPNWASDLNVSWNVIDEGGSGLREAWFRVSSDNKGSWGAWSPSNVTSTRFNQQGSYIIEVEAVDNAGNRSNTYSESYNIDKTNPTGSFSPNSQSWSGTDITVNFRPSDAHSGIRHWRYAISTDGGASWGAWSDYIYDGSPRDIVLTSNGNNKIKVEVTDKVWNLSVVTSGNYQIDKSTPTGSFSVNSHDWTNTDVVTRFTPSSGGSGMKHWRYATSSDNGKTWGDWSDYISGQSSRDITISSNGVNRVKAEVVNNVNRSAVITTGEIKIDKITPTATLTPNEMSWTNKTVPVTINMNDEGGSGIKSWQGRLSNNGGNTWNEWGGINTASNKVFNVDVEGNNVVAEIKIVDNAGNEEIVRSGVYQIDKTSPTGTFSPDSRDWAQDDIVTTFRPNDSLSGVKRWRYSISNDNGANWKEWSTYINGNESKDILINTSGNNRVKVEVEDNTGNVGTITSGVLKIDKISPSGNVVIPRTTKTQRIVVSVNNLNDIHSGVKSVRVSSTEDFSDNPEVVSVDGRNSVEIPFELEAITNPSDKNYADREIFVEVTDKVGNIKIYSGLTKVEALSPEAPKIIKPSNGDFIKPNDSFKVQWTFDDGAENPVKLSQKKAELSFTNKRTNEVIKYKAFGEMTEYIVDDLPNGEYDLVVEVFNTQDKSAVSDKVSFRKGVYNPNGHVSTIDIKPAGIMKYIKIVTAADIPNGSNIIGRAYYIEEGGNNFSPNKYIDFSISNSIDMRENIIRLPKKSSGLKIVYTLRGSDDGFIAPALDNIRVFAR